MSPSLYFLIASVCYFLELSPQVNTAAGVIEANVHPDANIIVGALVDERCGKQVSVTVLATGFATSEVRRKYVTRFSSLVPVTHLL